MPGFIIAYCDSYVQLNEGGFKMAQEDNETKKQIELLEKSIALQLFALGVPQSAIAKTVGKSKTWVNSLLRGVPKKGKTDGKKKSR